MIPNLEFQSVGNLRVEPLWRLKMHQHESTNELIVVIRGKERVLTDANNEFVLGPGDAILFPKQRAHEEYNHTDGLLETIFLVFTGSLSDEFIAVQDASSRLRDLARHLFRLNHLQDPAVVPLRQAYLNAIIGEFLLLDQPHTSDGLVTEVRAYIHRNLANPIQVDKLAKFANMSKYHFIRKYKSLSGITPMEEVRRMRLQEARNLITATCLPLKQIAEMTGFNDEYVFSKNFKKFFGTPPGSYKGTTVSVQTELTARRGQGRAVVSG